MSQNVILPSSDEAAAHMYPSDLKKFEFGEHTADIQILLSFIFTRFGAPGDAGELPDDVVDAVRRLERAHPLSSTVAMNDVKSQPIGRVFHDDDGEPYVSFDVGAQGLESGTELYADARAAAMLYQHDDGRFGLSFGPARFATGAPAWHRVPIDVVEAERGPGHLTAQVDAARAAKGE